MKRLTKEQYELYEYMSELSEIAYCAGWMAGWEVKLWDAIKNNISEIGRLELTNAIKENIHRLSKACDGWIIFDENEEFTPTKEWIELRNKSHKTTSN